MSDYAVEIALRAADEASRPMGIVMDAAEGLKNKLSGLADTILSGFGMGIGMDFGSKFSEAIRGAATAGFEFNKTMEDTRVGIGAVVLANMEFKDASGQVVTGQAAVTESLRLAEGVQADLRIDAIKTNFTYQELSRTFAGALAPALQAGVTNLKDVREISVMATQAMGPLGIKADEAGQEIRAMFAGEKGPDNRLNNQLGITKEMLDKVKGNADATGQLFRDKLAPYAAMADEAMKTLSGRLSTMGDNFDVLMGQASKPIFDAFKGAISGLTTDVGGFQGKLTEIGVKIGGLVTDVSPYIPKLIEFGVALLGAGVSFLSSLAPVLPILGEVLDLATGLIEELGPLGIGLIAGASAFDSIATGVAGAVQGVTAFGTWISTVGVATLGVYIVAIGVAVAALYALKLASDLSKENAAAEKSYTGMADTMVMNLGRIEKAHPELGKEVDRLKKEIVAAQREGGDAVEKSAGKFQKEFNSIAATARVLPSPINAATTAITALAKAPPIDPKVGKAIKDLGEEHDKVLEKINKEIERLGGDASKTAYSKYVADGLFEIRKLTKGWGEESDAVERRHVLLQKQLAEVHKEISKNLKPIPVEISGSWKTNLDKVNERLEEMTTDTYIQSAIQTSYLTGSPKGMFEEWDKKAALVKARDEIMTTDIYNEAVKQGFYVRRAPDESFAAWVENNAKALTSVKQFGTDLGTEAGKQAGTVAGVPGGMLSAWDGQFNLVKTRNETMTKDLDTEAGKQTGFVTSPPTSMFSAWDTQFGFAKIRNETFTTDLNTEAGKQTTAAGKPPADSLAAWTDSTAKSLDQVKGLATGMLIVVATPLTELKTAIGKTWGEITDGIQGQFESTGTFVKGVWGSMAGGIDQFFGDAFTGKGVDLQKTFEGIFGGIQKGFANMVSDMVQRWATGKQSLSDGIMALEDTLHPFQGSGFGATAGNAVLGGVAGYGFGSMVGSVSGAPGWQTGAQTGGALGGAIGSIIPGVGTVIGMVVGAIIGGIIGVIAAPNTEKHVSAAFSEMLSNSTTNAFAAAGRKVLESQQNWMVGLFEMGGKAAGLSASELTKAYSDSVKKLLAGGHAEISAGDNADIEKGLTRFLQENLPRLSLQAAFGQTGFGPHGNRDEVGGQGGLDWWVNWMDSEGNTITQKLYDPEAPIPKMLAGLGFTSKKISELATQLTSDNPEEFKKRLENLVGLVVDIDKAVASYAGGRVGIEAELDKRAGQTTTSYFSQTAQDIVDAASAMDALTGDEALARARQIANASNQRYEEELQAIQRIRDLAKSISESIASQREDLQVRLMTPDTRQNYYQAQINALMGQLGQATTEGEVQSLVQRIQGFASKLTDMAFPTGKDAGINTALVDWLDQILGQTDATAQARLSGFITDIVSTNDVLDGVLAGLKTRFTDIDTATENLAGSAGGAGAGLEQVEEKSYAAATGLQTFAEAVAYATAVLLNATGGGGTAISTIRRNPRVLMPQVGR